MNGLGSFTCKISGRSFSCLLKSDGQWFVVPRDPFILDFLNRNYAIGNYGPADGDPARAAVLEAAKRFKVKPEFPPLKPTFEEIIY